jgi:hypothetical protein
MDQETRDFDGSYYNAGEVDFCVWMLGFLLERGVPAANIGVITLYKAQARRIQEATMQLKCVYTTFIIITTA